MYNVTVDFPNLDKGTEVELDGLGIFENGYEYQVSEEEANAFRSKHSVQRTKTDKNGNMTTTLEQGPTVLEFFKKSPGVTVSKMSAEEKAAFDAERNPQPAEGDNNEEVNPNA